MNKAVVSDFSRVLLFPADESYAGSLNALNKTLTMENPDYDFWKYFRLNEALLEYYASLDVPVYIFTSDTIQNHPAIKSKLDAIFKDVLSAKELNVSKADPLAYGLIAKRLQLQPKEVMYIDDQKTNITAALDAGFSTTHYRSNKDVVDKIG